MKKTTIPWVFDKIEFARILIMIYAISVSKYVNVRSLKKIRGPTYSEGYPKIQKVENLI